MTKHLSSGTKRWWWVVDGCACDRAGRGCRYRHAHVSSSLSCRIPLVRPVARKRGDGARRKMGEIAHLLEKADSGESPLEIKLHQLVRARTRAERPRLDDADEVARRADDAVGCNVDCGSGNPSGGQCDRASGWPLLRWRVRLSSSLLVWPTVSLLCACWWMRSVQRSHVQAVDQSRRTTNSPACSCC